MKKTILAILLTYSFLNGDGLIESFTKHLSKNFGSITIERFKVGDSTKFKIGNNKVGYITNGMTSCNLTNAYLLGEPSDKCTVFENKDNYKVLVSLMLVEEMKIIKELWTVHKNKDNKTIQFSRPNGFKVEILR